MAEPDAHLFDESEDDTHKKGEADPEEIELPDIEKDLSASSLDLQDESEALDRITLAAKEGKEEDVRRELEELSEDERTAILKEKDLLGYTALHYAVKNNHVNVIELLLLVYGADPEIMTEEWIYNNCTALHLAAVLGHLEAVKLLVDPKKHATTHEAHDKLEPAQVDTVDEDGQTPLHYASREDRTEVVTVLLEYGAQVDRVDNNGKSALHIASEKGHVGVATVLIEQGADVNKGEETGETPLHLASSGEMAICLLEHGADVNKGDEDEQTPLHFACEHENLEVVTALLEHGADVNKADSSGDTPLQEITQAEDSAEEIIKTLLEHGADVNKGDNSGTTPLANACYNGSVKIANTLLEYKADVNKAETDGTTPLHTACDWGYTEVVEVLLNKGADVTKKNDSGLNPLMVAVQEGHEDVAMAFVKHKSWKAALHTCAEETTPMRELIKKMPDVAAEVLDRCTETSETFSKGSENFDVTFNYEMVEDFQDDGAAADDDIDFDDEDDEDDDSRSCLSRACKCCLPRDGGFTSDWGPKGFNRFKHPLYLMAQTENIKLLKHPLVTTLLRRKWRVTQFVYFSNLFFYCIFLGFLTAFALTAPNPQTAVCDAIFTNSSSNVDCEQSAGRRRFVFAAGLITLILGITRIVVETLQAIQLRADYFSDWVNWMEIIMVIFSFIFIWVFNTECLCPTRWQWQFGTIAVFLAWTDFIIFVQKLPGIGIYVVMLIDILWIFVKTVPLTIMLVIAFGLGLFMAFFEPQVTRSPFSTPARSLLSVVTYSTGGFDFDAIFRQAPGATMDDNDLVEIPFPTASYVMWITFIIIMPILLNNLLIGLAVGDINDTLEKAEGKKVALEIELTLSVEATLPTKLRRKFIVGEELLYPNDTLSFGDKMEKAVWGADRFPTGGFIANAVKKEDLDPVKQLPQQTLSLVKDVQEMKKTLSHLSSLSEDIQEIKQVVKDLQKALADTAAKQDQQATP